MHASITIVHVQSCMYEICHYLEAGGVSYVRCERCNFTGNSGLNSSDEYGAAVALKRIVPFENRENIPKYDFIDW